jgi:RHS repeat-associated protein
VGNTGTIDYAYNAADQLTSATKSGQTTNYTYDTNGNQASAGTRTFTYNLADQLASTTNAGTTTTYGYDGDGRRVASTIGGGGADLRAVWDPLAETNVPELALERTPSGSLIRRYVAGPLGALSMTNSSATYWYHQDPLATVTDVTDGTGTAQWKYEYEAYGAERSATNVSGSAPENRLRFNSQYLDTETTLYHLRARQYDPAIGRFGALDPVENPVLDPYASAYGYVTGRPTVLVDPLGLCGLESFGDFLGCGTSAAKGVLNTGAGALHSFTGGGSTWLLNQASIHPDTNSWTFRVGEYGVYAIPARGLVMLGTRVARHGLGAIGRRGLIVAGSSGAANLAVGYGLSYFSCLPYSWEMGLFDLTFGGLTRLGSTTLGPAGLSTARYVLSPNQMNQAILRGQAPKGIRRVDQPKVPHEQLHVTFDDGSALNIDGTWKHGGRPITNAQREWLVSNGWVVPEN